MLRERVRRWLVLTGLIVLAGVALVFGRGFLEGRARDELLTPEEREWFEQHSDSLVLGPYLNAPLSFINDQGEFSGIAADYARLLEGKLGVEFRKAPPTSISELLQNMRAGRVDLASGLTRTPERLDYLVFSEPYVRIPNLIVVRQGTWELLTLEKLRGLRIAVGESFGAHEYLQRTHPELQLTPVPNDLEGLLRLSTGEVDVMIVHVAALSFHITRENLTNLHVAGRIPYEYELAMAVRKDEPILLRIIQKGLDQITEKEKEIIRRRWVYAREPPFYLDPLFWRIVALLLVGMGGVVGTVITWNKALKREVRARTHELAEAHRNVSFLAEASIILSETLDYGETLSRLGALCVRHFADWCVIDVVREGQVRRLAGAHVNPTKRPLLDTLSERYPAHEGSRSPAGVVLRTRQPLLYPELSEEDIRATCESEEHTQLIVALGTRSAIAVPLVSRGNLLGVLTLGSGLGRRYGRKDLELAQEVARHATLAYENARLYQQAQEAIRIRDAFLMVAAHELRTPLTSLKLRLSILHRLAQGAPEQQVRTDALLRELPRLEALAERLRTLIEQLLEVSCIGAGRFELRREELDLCQVVQDVVDDLREQLARSGSRLDVRTGCPALGRWDRIRVEQVITNLLENAIKFGEGRPLELRVEPGPDTVRLVVRDQGIGLPSEARARIFEKFERAVSERHYGGLGLGLFITRQIVEAHGGTISVESTPGEGSTFTVVLPSGEVQVATSPSG